MSKRTLTVRYKYAGYPAYLGYAGYLPRPPRPPGVVETHYTMLPVDILCHIESFLGTASALQVLPIWMGRGLLFASPVGSPLRTRYLVRQKEQQAFLHWWYRQYLQATSMEDLKWDVLSEAEREGFHDIPEYFGQGFRFFLLEYVHRIFANLAINEQGRCHVTTALVWVFHNVPHWMTDDTGNVCACDIRLRRFQAVMDIQESIQAVNAVLMTILRKLGYAGVFTLLDEHWECGQSSSRLEIRLKVPLLVWYANYHKLWPVRVPSVEQNYTEYGVDMSVCLLEHRMTYSCMSGFVWEFKGSSRSPFGFCTRCQAADLELHSSCYQALFTGEVTGRFPVFLYMSQGHRTVCETDARCDPRGVMHTLVVPSEWHSFCKSAQIFPDTEERWMQNVLTAEEAHEHFAEEYGFLVDIFPQVL